MLNIKCILLKYFRMFNSIHYDIFQITFWSKLQLTIAHWFQWSNSDLSIFDFLIFDWFKSCHIIIQAILIPLITIIEKLFALKFGRIGFLHQIWQFSLVTNFRKKYIIFTGEHNFMFFLFRRVTLICRTINLSRIGQNR